MITLTKNLAFKACGWKNGITAPDAGGTLKPATPQITMDDPKGFFAALFDFSFTSFITIKLVKFIYILNLIGIAIGMLAIIGMGFANGFMSGIVSIILAPVFGLLMTMLARVWMEMVIVMFRISDDVNKISKKP